MARSAFTDPEEPAGDFGALSILTDAARISPPAPPARPADPVVSADERPGAARPDAAAEPTAAELAARTSSREDRDVEQKKPRGKNEPVQTGGKGKPGRKPKSTSARVTTGPRGTLYKSEHDQIALMEAAVDYAKLGEPHDDSYILFDCFYRLHPDKRPAEGRHAKPSRVRLAR